MRPEHTGPTTAIFEHVDVGYWCIYRHDLRVHMWALQAENNNHFDFFRLFPLEFRGLFLCDFFVDVYILFHIHCMLIYLTLSLMSIMSSCSFTARLNYVKFYQLRL